MTIKLTDIEEAEALPLIDEYQDIAEIEQAYRQQFGSYAGIENFIAACCTIEDAKAVLAWTTISKNNYAHD